MLLVAAFVAAIMIILGGFLSHLRQCTRAAKARRITNAILAILFLGYTCFFILSIRLVEFRSLKIKIIERKELELNLWIGQSLREGSFLDNLSTESKVCLILKNITFDWGKQIIMKIKMNISQGGTNQHIHRSIFKVFGFQSNLLKNISGKNHRAFKEKHPILAGNKNSLHTKKAILSLSPGST